MTLVMLIVHNLDHMMQPNEWETLLTREIHGARVKKLIFTCVFLLCLSRSSLYRS